MKATPFSEKQYFPAMLSNGRSSVLIDYTGANFNGRNAHSHLEQNQGTLCGWYKPCQAALTGINLIQPVMRAGIQVVLYRAAAEPQWYEQEFFPRTATLQTMLRFAGGLELQIENFLTDDEIWCQKISVKECPEDCDAGIGFLVDEASMGKLTTPQKLPFETEFQAEQKSETLHLFTYRTGTVRGGGFLRSEKPYDVAEKDGGLFLHVKKGFSVSRMLCCLDESDGADWEERVNRMSETKLSYGDVYRAHCERWAATAGDTTVELPEQNLQELYELSKYVLYACQNPDYGGITTGPLPHLWGGGLYCAPDSLHAHLALLSSGNLERGRNFINFYLSATEKNREVLHEHGFPGVAFSGWDDCKGNSLEDYLRFVTVYKPFNSGLVITAIYHQWRYDPQSLDEEKKAVIRDVLAYWDALLIKREGEHVFLAPVEAGTEGGFLVKVDTFIQMSIGKALIQAAEMLDDARRMQEGEELLQAIDQNKIDGLLMPFDGAAYTGGISLFASPFDIPRQIIDCYSLDETLRRCKTPWGYTLEQTTEEYRLWPWADSLAALSYTRLKEPQKAMEYLRHLDRLTNALGVLPEKQRLDGFVIGYWYMTPHAIAVWAIHDAIAFCDRPGELCILQGVSDVWKKLKAEHICLPDQLSVSLKVENGALTMLNIENKSAQEQTLRLCINPMFQGSFTENVITIAGNGRFVYNAEKGI